MNSDLYLNNIYIVMVFYLWLYFSYKCWQILSENGSIADFLFELATSNFCQIKKVRFLPCQNKQKQPVRLLQNYRKSRVFQWQWSKSLMCLKTYLSILFNYAWICGTCILEFQVFDCYLFTCVCFSIFSTNKLVLHGD